MGLKPSFGKLVAVTPIVTDSSIWVRSKMELFADRLLALPTGIILLPPAGTSAFTPRPPRWRGFALSRATATGALVRLPVLVSVVGSASTTAMALRSGSLRRGCGVRILMPNVFVSASWYSRSVVRIWHVSHCLKTLWCRGICSVCLRIVESGMDVGWL